MTLFEVAISLVIMTVGILSCIMLFPAGIKAQQMAKMKLLAGAKAQEMVDSFVSSTTANPTIDVEAYNPWDVPVTYRSLSWDLETRLSSHRFGIMPLPLEIARRLDSENDEIQTILDQGGYIYYSQPNAVSSMQETSLEAAPANENQTLIFAVTGYAQQDSLTIFPWKAWPYVGNYPSPPLHAYRPTGGAENIFTSGLTGNFVFHYWTHWDFGDSTGVTPEELVDPRMVTVLQAYEDYEYGTSPTDQGPTEAKCIAYIQAALAYCVAVGVPSYFYDPPVAPDPTFMPGVGLQFTPIKEFEGWTSAQTAAPAAHLQVQAIRFLAHAAACITYYHRLNELGGQPSVAGSGFPIPAAATAIGASPAVELTHDKLLYYHESCLNLAMLFASRFPYDFGAPRPIQRSIMMDHPLFEPDLFGAPLSGTHFNGNPLAPGVSTAQHWRPIPGQPLKNPGASYSFPNRPLPAAGNPFWGDQAHFTLTRKFQPKERCRQIVFWSADWQSYQDFETAPSAPVDAGKYPIAAPLAGVTFDQRLSAVSFRDEMMYAFRNPEKTLLFVHDMTGTIATPPPAPSRVQTGTILSKKNEVDILLTPNDANPHVPPDRIPSAPATPDQIATAKMIFTGQYGADRNFNYRLDRGPVPPSVRLRATQVARFNFYDGRVPAPIR